MRILITSAILLLANASASSAPAANSPDGSNAKLAGRAFALAPRGCAMAHCDPHLSGDTNSVSPTVANLIYADIGSKGSGHGLSCVSDSKIVACTLGGNPPAPSDLVVYDGDGNRLWDDGGILGSTADASVPIIGKDGTVIAADRNWILRADPATGTILWKSAKPDTGVPISPVPAGSDSSMVLVATGFATAGTVAEVSIWDVASGALLSHGAITDPATGAVYATQNTPAVSGNRAYVLTAAADDPDDGRLYALDICNDASCVRGSVTMAWHYDFDGPSGASPLIIGSQIFFDGRPAGGGGTFMAVNDLGTSESLAWSRHFAGQFIAGAALDPRGGLWVFPFAGNTSLLRLNPKTGKTLQTVPVSSAAGLPSGYTPASAVSVSKSATAAVVLTFAARTPSGTDLPNYVVALDVGTTTAGSLLWRYQVASSVTKNSVEGQFPIATGASGSQRVVFSGTHSGTFFVGAP